MVCWLSLMGQHCVETVAPTTTSPRPSKRLLKRRLQLYRHPRISRVFMASVGSWWEDCTAVRPKAFSTTQDLLARGVGSTAAPPKVRCTLSSVRGAPGWDLNLSNMMTLRMFPSTNMYTRALQLSMFVPTCLNSHMARLSKVLTQTLMRVGKSR